MSAIIKLSKSFILSLLFLSTATFAQDIKLEFEPQTVNLKPNEKQEIKLFVKNAPEVYGIELQLKFDPEYLKIIDNKNLKEATKLSSGSFFDIKKSFFVQNKVDNKSGTIGYLLTLLNPAKEVKGEGEIFHLTLQALKEGNTKISFNVAKLGTRKGKVLVPTTKNLDVKISDTNILFENWYLILVVLLLVLLFIILVKRKAKSSN